MGIKKVPLSILNKNLIGYGQSSAHHLLDDRWIASLANTQGNCLNPVSLDVSVRKRILRA